MTVRLNACVACYDNFRETLVNSQLRNSCLYATTKRVMPTILLAGPVISIPEATLFQAVLTARAPLATCQSLTFALTIEST